jgi:hypothetical protein
LFLRIQQPIIAATCRSACIEKSKTPPTPTPNPLPKAKKHCVKKTLPTIHEEKHPHKHAAEPSIAPPSPSSSLASDEISLPEDDVIGFIQCPPLEDTAVAIETPVGRMNPSALFVDDDGNDADHIKGSPAYLNTLYYKALPPTHPIYKKLSKQQNRNNRTYIYLNIHFYVVIIT